MASNEKKLKAAKERLENTYKVPVYSLHQDLSQIGAAGKVYNQVKDLGIQVAILMNNAGYGLVGATQTEFFKRENTQTPRSAMTAKRVAEIAYKGLMKNKEVIIPGFKNKLLMYIPIKIKMKAVAKMKQA